MNGCVDSYISLFAAILNAPLDRGCFPNQLKFAEVTNVLKKDDELSKENYNPVSVLSRASRILDRIVFTQMNLFFESKFSSLLTGFSKNNSTQNV